MARDWDSVHQRLRHIRIDSLLHRPRVGLIFFCLIASTLGLSACSPTLFGYWDRYGTLIEDPIPEQSQTPDGGESIALIEGRIALGGITPPAGGDESSDQTVSLKLKAVQATYATGDTSGEPDITSPLALGSSQEPLLYRVQFCCAADVENCTSWSDLPGTPLSGDAESQISHTTSPNQACAYRAATVTSQGMSRWARLSVPVQPTAPAAPSGLKVCGATSARIDFCWEDQAGTETHYEVVVDSGAAIELNPNAEFYSLTGLSAGQSVSLSVRAVNARGAGAPLFSSAATLTATAQPSALPAIENFYLVSSEAKGALCEANLSATVLSTLQSRLEIAKSTDLNTWTLLTTSDFSPPQGRSVHTFEYSGDTTFRIRAAGSAGATDISSPWVQVLVPNCVAQSAVTLPRPALLQANEVPGGVRLSWNEETVPPGTVLRIAKCEGDTATDCVDGDSFQYLDAFPQGITSFLDTDVSTGDYYRYEARWVFTAPDATVSASNPRLTASSLLYLNASQAPNAVSGLRTVGVSTSQVILSWNATLETTHYDIQELAVSGGLRCDLTTTTSLSSSPVLVPATSVIDASVGASPSTSICYRIRAVNAVGNGEWSEPIGPVTPSIDTQLVTPESLTLGQFQGSSLTLTWEVPDYLQNYSFQIGMCEGATCSSFTTLATSAPGQSQFTVNGLNEGDIYRFQVTAIAPDGSTAGSLSSPPTTAQTSPLDPPQSFVVSESTSNAVALQWSPLASGYAYQIQRACIAPTADCTAYGGGSYINLPGAFPTTTGATRFIDTGLVPEVRWVYRIRTVPEGTTESTVVAGTWSTQSVAVEAYTEYKAPDSPSSFQSLSNPDVIHLSWGSPFTGIADETPRGYRIYRCTGGSCIPSTSDLIRTLSGVNSTSVSDTSVTGGTTYRYQVRAFVYDSAEVLYYESSPMSLTAQAALAAPSASVTSLNLASSSSSTLQLAWSPLSVSSQSTLDQIEVEYCRNSTSQIGTCEASYVTFSTSPVLAVTPDATGLTVADLTPDRRYNIRVRLKNSAGVGPYSQLNGLQTQPSRLNTPTALTFMGAEPSSTTAGSARVLIAWSDQSSEESNYEITHCEIAASASSCTLSNAQTLPANSSLGVIDGVGLNARVLVSVRALSSDSARHSVAATLTQVLSNPSTPLPPNDFRLTSSTATTLNFSWSTQSTATEAWVLDRKAGTDCQNSSGYGSEVTIEDETTLNAELSGLTPSTSYCVRLRAKMGLIIPIYSTATVLGPILTEISLPATPSLGSMTLGAPTYIDLSWQDNASSEIDYEIQQASYSSGTCLTTSGYTVLSATLPAGTQAYRAISLTPTQDYCYRVRASAGTASYQKSAWHTFGPFTAAYTVPAAPTDLILTPVASSIALSWTDGVDNEEGFDLQLCAGSDCNFLVLTESLSKSANSTSHSFTGLAINSVYRVRIRATNSVGNSSWVSSGNITTLGPSTTVSTLGLSPYDIPHDDLSTATVTVQLKNSGGANYTDTAIVEIYYTETAVGSVTLTGAGACATPASSCVRAANAGAGRYTATVRGDSAQTLTIRASFSIDGVTSILSSSSSLNIDTSNYVSIDPGGSTAATISSAQVGQNIWIKSGTVTFDESTVGQTFGHLLISGGTVTHPVTTSSTVHRLSLNVASLTMRGSGRIDVSNLGYPSGYSYGPTAPSNNAVVAPGLCGGSHGGEGGRYSGFCTTSKPTYGDYRDPNFPGSGSSGKAGGGVVRIQAFGACILNGTSQILAIGQSTGGGGDYGGAGGSIKLQCESIAGDSIGVSGVILNASGGGTAHVAGGGGRIALITSDASGSSAFSGSFAYPNTSGQMATFLGYVRARGGDGHAGNAFGNGGAGTIYLHYSGSTHGDLIVSNGGINQNAWGGTTPLISLTGTLGAQLNSGASSMTLGSSVVAELQNLYAGMRIRPDPTFTNGTSANWADDNVLTVSSNNLSNLTFSSSSTQTVANGTPFRSIDIVDHAYFDGNAIITTNGDFYAVNGLLTNPAQADVTITNALFNPSASSLVQFYTDTAISTSLTSSSINYPPNIRILQNLVLSDTSSITSSGNITIAGALTISSGSPSLSASGNITLGGAFTVSGGSPSISSLGTIIFPEPLVLNAGTPTISATQITAPSINASVGTLTHPASTTTTTYRLNIITPGAFTLAGNARIDVSNLGYPSGYSYGPTAPSNNAVVAPGACGGSHGGEGARYSSCTTSRPTYGDYRDPNFPGSGSGGNNGGGVVRVQATGACTLNDTAQILAVGGFASGGGGWGGAGGSIKLQCASIGGNSVGVSSVILNASAGGANNVAGGGGRIALITNDSSSTSAFSGLFAYPNTSGQMATFLGYVRARGGVGNGTSFGNGGAGTIYLQHSDSTHGDLIISNGGTTQNSLGGITRMPAATANSNILFSSSGTTGQITSASTPLANLIDLYRGMFLQVWSSAGGFTNPLDTTNRTEVILNGSPEANTSNTFVTNGTLPTTSGSTHSYRMVYKVDQLHLTGNAQVDFNGADLIIAGPPGGSNGCDLISMTNGAFDVPTGSSLTVNALASNYCSILETTGTVTRNYDHFQP